MGTKMIQLRTTQHYAMDKTTFDLYCRFEDFLSDDWDGTQRTTVGSFQQHLSTLAWLFKAFLKKALSNKFSRAMASTLLTNVPGSTKKLATGTDAKFNRSASPSLLPEEAFEEERGFREISCWTPRSISGDSRRLYCKIWSFPGDRVRICSRMPNAIKSVKATIEIDLYISPNDSVQTPSVSEFSRWSVVRLEAGNCSENGWQGRSLCCSVCTVPLPIERSEYQKKRWDASVWELGERNACHEEDMLQSTAIEEWNNEANKGNISTVLIDGTNMRGKFGFKWNAAGVAGLVQKWAGIHEMQGKAIVIFDNKDNKKTFVSPGEGVASIVAGDGADADQVITDAITFFHDMDINTVVATNDKKLMRECVAVCGAGMKARNFFFTNNDFAQVLNMPTNYVKLKQRASDMDDSNVLEAMNAYLSRYPEGNLAITSFHSDSDLYVSPENDQEPA
eukprot:jgi/Bigna1/68970/fgenesh1_pg.7_\